MLQRRSALPAVASAAEKVSFKRVVTLPRHHKPGHVAPPLFALLTIGAAAAAAGEEGGLAWVVVGTL